MRTTTSARARVAALKRHGHAPEEVRQAQDELRAAVLTDHVRRLVDEAPPLSAEQRNRLALLLLGGTAA